MKKFIVMLLIVGFTGVAHALPKAKFSFGQGVVPDNDFSATAFNAELVPSFSFLLVSADLGLMYELNKGKNFITSPGLTINLFGLFGKVAIPIRNFFDDWGFRFGIGKDIFSIPLLSIFIEIDTYLWHSVDFKDYIPVEARLGVDVGF